jgi:hypothetical protein
MTTPATCSPAASTRRVTGPIVISTFLTAADRYGPPQSTLTDNGSVYTSRFTGGRNGLEYLLANLGITQKNGHPNHPQTQGKIERFHQTLKRWLAAQPAAATPDELQAQLNRFQRIYNQLRPHRALNRLTPAVAYAATPKARPATTVGDPGHYRLRYDRTDNHGKMSIRRAGRMHHLGVGANNAHRRVLAIADQTTVTVIDLLTG